jgi:hypothetical protein
VVERQDGGRPVFTDDSGTRARVSRRVVRALCGLVALGVVAVVLSAALHITLPGLDHPLALPGAKKATTPAPRVPRDVEQPLATTGATTAAEAAAPTTGPTSGPTTGPTTSRLTSSPVVAGVETSAPAPVVARATAPPARRSPTARPSAVLRPHPGSPSARPQPATPTSHPAPPSRPPSAATPTPRPRATRPAPVLPSAATGKPAPVLPSPAPGNARVAVPTR